MILILLLSSQAMSLTDLFVSEDRSLLLGLCTCRSLQWC
jgi:hypothetical protein